MKKASAILILLIFFFCQTAYYFACTLMKYCEQERMEEHLLSTLPEKKCEVINFTLLKDQIQWKEKGETFILKGIEYDVAKTKIAGGNVYLYCITEKKEQEILGDISLKITGADDYSGHMFNLVFSGDYLVAKTPDEISIPRHYSSKIFSPNHMDLSDPWKGILLPPPRTRA